MRKITFNEKENSVLTNSLYILNADNINEIKLVINNLIDYFEKTDFKFYDVFKFISISLPNFYENGEFDLEFEFSTNEMFSISKKISSKNNPDAFYIFENGKYINFNNKKTITKDDVNKSLLVDVSSISFFNSIIENKANRKYYGRYRVKNENTTSDYFGISFSNSNFDFTKINIGDTLTITNKDENNLKFDEETKRYFELLTYDIQQNSDVELKTFLYKENKYVDVTKFTKYSINEENLNYTLNENIFKDLNNTSSYNLITIIGETKYNYETYYSRIKLNIIPTIMLRKIDLNFIINDDIKNQIIFKSNEKYDFNLEFLYNNNVVKYSENTEFFKLIYDDSLIEITENEDEQQINVKTILDDVTKNSSKILIEYDDGLINFEKEIPYTIKNEYQVKDIDVVLSQKVFTKETLNNNYKVELIDLDDNRIDITSKTNVEILNDNSYLNNNIKYNYVEFIKEEGIFNVYENISSFETFILFEYYDEKINKTFRKIKSISINNNFEFLNIELSFPEKLEINETGKYNVTLNIKNNETGEIITSDITNSCTITSNDRLIFNNGNISFNKSSYLCEIIDYKQYLINVEYLYNDKFFQKEVIINVYKNQILNISILGADTLNCEETSSEYEVILKYIDGQEFNITKDENLKLYIVENDNAILHENKITTTILRNPYNIILIAEYNDGGCNNLIYTASKNIYVYPYKLTHTTLNGDDEIQSNKQKTYYTDAFYSNGKQIKNVYARYTISDISGNIFNEKTSPVISSFNYEDNGITLKAKKTFIDKEFILSSYYEEPEYEDTENSLISKKIKVIGGFEVTLHGKLLTSNGTYNWNKNNIQEIVFSSPSSQFIRDLTKDDDETIKQFDKGNYLISFDWNNLIGYFTPNDNSVILETPANIKKLFYYTSYDNENNNIIYGYVAKIYQIISGEKYFIKSINTSDLFEFEKDCSYEIEFCSIASLNGSYFSSNLFEINKSFNDSYILGFEGVYFEDGFQILNIIVTFETSTGYEYNDTFTYLKEYDMWIVKDIPKKAAKIKSINVSYAFNDKEF